MLLAVVAVEGTLLWTAQELTVVVTPHGMRPLRRGMSASDVASVLGPPLAAAESVRQGLDCFRYGRPTWKAPFPVYSLCFAAGRLREVSQKQYGLWKVKPDGTFVPFQEPPPVKIPPAKPGNLF